MITNHRNQNGIKNFPISEPRTKVNLQEVFLIPLWTTVKHFIPRFPKILVVIHLSLT